VPAADNYVSNLKMARLANDAGVSNGDFQIQTEKIDRKMAAGPHHNRVCAESGLVGLADIVSAAPIGIGLSDRLRMDCVAAGWRDSSWGCAFCSVSVVR
jgi:hypothetical protein